MAINVEENKMFYRELLKCCNRDGINNLLDWLDTTDFYEAPCSTHFHLCERGGLCQHSLNVYLTMAKLATEVGEWKNKRIDLTPAKATSEHMVKTYVLVGLLHDLCKINTYKEVLRWRKNSDNLWEQYPTYEFDEDFAYGHGEKSVYLASKFIKLTDEEAQAINGHMGFSDVRGVQLAGNIFKQNYLAVLLHMADISATYFMEE